MGLSLDGETLYASLATMGSPWFTVEHHRTIDSTNARAAGLGEPWRVVVADHQSAGRGRLSRSWEAPPGTSVAVSATVPLPTAGAGWLPLIAGLAVAEAVEAETSLQAHLKWPNDVLLPADGDRKVSGVLCEVVGGGFVVVGAGINVSQGREELPVDTATSLALARGEVDEPVDRNRLVAAYLSRLACWYASLAPRSASDSSDQVEPAATATSDVNRMRDAYRGRCVTIGRRVALSRPPTPDVVGRAVAVDDEGRLVLDTSEGRSAWAAGDVTHVRSAR